MAYIVRTFIYRYFKNYLCTITGFFFIGLYVFALIVPFLFALSTGEFWQQIKMSADQPKVSLNGNYIIQCNSGFRNETSSNIVSVTDKDYADYTYINEDQFADGNTDFISFTISMIPTYIVDSCTIVLFANVGLRNKIKLQMISPIIFSINEDFQNFGVQLFGDLQFQQKETLPQLTLTRQIYNIQENDQKFPPNIFDYYSTFLHQNETMIPNYQSFRIMKSESNRVIIKGKLKIEAFQTIYYSQTVLQGFRDIWIQYIFIAIPIFYLIYSLGQFAVQKKIFFAHQQVLNDQYNTF